MSRQAGAREEEKRFPLRNVKMQTKLIAAFSFVCLLAVILFFIFTQSTVFDRFKSEITDNTQQLCQKIIQNVDTYFDKMDEISKKLLSNPTLLSVMDKVNRSAVTPTNYETLNRNRQLGEIVSKAIALTSFPFLNVCIYSNDGRYKYVYGEDKSTFPKILRDDSFSQDLSERRMFVYATPSANGEENSEIISFIRTIFDVGGKRYGYIEIQGTTDQLAEICSTNGSARATVVDEHDRIIYTSDAVPREELGNLRGRIGDSMEGMFQSGTDDALFYTVSDYSGVSVYLRYSYDNIYSSLILIKNTTMLLIAVVALLCFALVILFSKRITRPIRELRDSVMSVNYQNMGLSLRDTDNNEVAMLGSAFQQILDELKISVDREIVSQQAEADARLSALQTQIAPHFIHNTLYAISIAAREQRTDDVVFMCKQLSDMLRYKMNASHKSVRLEDEMAFVVGYLSLEMKNYEDSLSYEIHIDEATKTLPVPRLFVQPFVENALQHGFEKCRPPYRISLSSERIGDRWKIVVQDNGTGINPAAVRRIYQKIAENKPISAEETGSPRPRAGMGIVNSVLRIKILYADSFRLNITSPAEGGTVVTLEGAMPLEKEKEENACTV